MSLGSEDCHRPSIDVLHWRVDVFWSFLGNMMSFVLTINRRSTRSMCTSMDGSRFLPGKTIGFSIRWDFTSTMGERMQTALEGDSSLWWILRSLCIRVENSSLHYPIESIPIEAQMSHYPLWTWIARQSLVPIRSPSMRMDNSTTQVRAVLEHISSSFFLSPGYATSISSSTSRPGAMLTCYSCLDCGDSKTSQTIQVPADQGYSCRVSDRSRMISPLHALLFCSNRNRRCSVWLIAMLLVGAQKEQWMAILCGVVERIFAIPHRNFVFPFLRSVRFSCFFLSRKCWSNDREIKMFKSVWNLREDWFAYSPLESSVSLFDGLTHGHKTSKEFHLNDYSDDLHQKNFMNEMILSTPN